MKNIYPFLILALVIIVAGCATTSTQVTQVSNDDVPDLSGRWNANDSRDVSQQMIMSMLASPRLAAFRNDQNRPPRIIIGQIQNLSSEHIETATFIKDIEREITNSGKAVFVSSKNERQVLRQERLDQQSYASDDSAKNLASETAADFMLMGSIKSMRDALSGKEVIIYQVDLELVNIETNEKIWLETLPKNKIIYRKKNRF